MHHELVSVLSGEAIGQIEDRCRKYCRTFHIYSQPVTRKKWLAMQLTLSVVTVRILSNNGDLTELTTTSSNLGTYVMQIDGIALPSLLDAITIKICSTFTANKKCSLSTRDKSHCQFTLELATIYHRFLDLRENTNYINTNCYIES